MNLSLSTTVVLEKWTKNKQVKKKNIEKSFPYFLQNNFPIQNKALVVYIAQPSPMICFGTWLSVEKNEKN